jgi:hypothetical protein
LFGCYLPFGLLATRSSGPVYTYHTIHIPEDYFCTFNSKADFFLRSVGSAVHTAMNHFSLDVYILALLKDFELDVHESVHRGTTMKKTNKMHYID